MINNPEFDQYADDYDAALAQSLELTGEDKHYFARGRMRLVADVLGKQGIRIHDVLDFGCGIGSATPYFFEMLNADSVVGVDVSPKSLNVARSHYVNETRAKFATIEEYRPESQFDLAFTTGVFHHIPLEHREQSAAYVFQSLRANGLFAFWENSPWNLGTRFVMSRCPFDKDAIRLSPPEARRLLRKQGFEILSTLYLFIFPHALKWLRGLEKPLSSLPLGAQYLVLCRKPDDKDKLK
jgi:SAM-dependent methyltransferase